MKTTLDLPDDVMRAVKIRAVEENRRLKDTIADLLRRGLAQELRGPAPVRRRVKLALVVCAHEARRRAAAERLKRAMREELVEVGPRTWTREDLYER
jgi:plasmid stability protein